jgi:hypothetical protein
VKPYLKFLAAVALAAILWFAYRHFFPPARKLVSYETLTINGFLDAESFVELRDRLMQSKAELKTFVVTASGGGDGEAALAIGTLLHRHNWDVEVVGTCASSCANFIFPAGKTKYLRRHALILFHGGPYQANLMEMAQAFDKASTNGMPTAAVTLGQANKEGTLNFTPKPSSDAQKEVRKFLSFVDSTAAVDWVLAMRGASDKFYQELGVNAVLPTYGQIGPHEAQYQSYKHGGFIYNLDSLRALGIRNIELKDGEWQPKGNADYPDVYEVTYP